MHIFVHSNTFFLAICFEFTRNHFACLFVVSLLHSCFKYQSVSISTASLPYSAECSAVIQTDTIHMSDRLRASFIFFTLSFCDEKNCEHCCLISVEEAIINLRGQNSNRRGGENNQCHGNTL